MVDKGSSLGMDLFCKDTGLDKMGHEKSIHSRKVSSRHLYMQSGQGKTDHQGLAMKMLWERKIYLGWRGGSVCWENNMDIEAITASLQLRDGACTRTQRQKQPMAAPPVEGRLQTAGMTVHIPLHQRVSTKKPQPNPPYLGITGEGWGFPRAKYRGGQKSPIICRFKNNKNRTYGNASKTNCPFYC